MLFLSIMTYDPQQRDLITERFLKSGYGFPAQVKIVHHWTDLGGGRQFGVFETNDPLALMVATRAWSDIMTSELIPIIEAQETIKLLQK